MSYKIGVTVSDEYPVKVDKVKEVFGNMAEISVINMPFRPLTSDEEAGFVPILKPYNALLVRSGVFTENIMKQLPELRVICVHGAGYDQVDVKAAANLGICVLNTPGANANGVIELTMSLMLALQRRLYNSIFMFKHEHDWSNAKQLGCELKDKTLGLIGAGKIGFGVAKKALAFGMKVKIYDPYITQSQFDDNIKVYKELKSVLEDADIISLHAPLTQGTKHVINKNTIAYMKKSALLINTSRGALIDEGDLLAALQHGDIGGAALDVFETEPLNSDSPLFNLKNVLITPHIGGSTVESLENVALMASKEILSYLETKTSAFRVN